MTSYQTDSMVNFVTGMAQLQSKYAGDRFLLRQLEPAEASAMYRSDWVGRKIIDVPVFDMLREWRDWQAEGPAIEAMESAEEHHKVAAKLSHAARLADLHGGSAIIVGADASNPEMPLTPRRVGKGGLKYLTVVSRTSLNTPEMDNDPRSPTFGQPLYYELVTPTGMGVRLHPSRVIAFFGPDRLDDEITRIDPWGDSRLLAVYDAIHHAALTQQGIAELVHEAKIDVIQIDNLGSKIGNDSQQSDLTKRFAYANMVKSINRMLLLDKNEVWERKQTSFTGLPEVLDRYLQIVAAAADIPATRLLGTTSKGLNNSGDGDLRNYYDSLVGRRQKHIGPQLAYLDMILWVDATGSIPRDAYAEWCPMWQMSEKEKAEIAEKRANTSKIYAEMGALDENALRKGIENQLIEDGVYPGLEAAIAALQSGGNDPVHEAGPTPGDNPAPDSANGNNRDRSIRSA